LSLELSTIADGQIVLARSSGRNSAEDRERHRAETIRFCREKGIHALIVDVRGQVYTSSTASSFELGRTAPEMTRGLRIAFVRDPDDADTRFVDNVAANRGAMTRSFLSLEEARAWLRPTDNEF
jgi:hypothetical protein